MRNKWVTKYFNQRRAYRRGIMNIFKRKPQPSAPIWQSELQDVYLRTHGLWYRALGRYGEKLIKELICIDKMYIQYYPFHVKFEWDDQKNQTNILKHGINFEDAKAIFEEKTGKRVEEV